MGFLGDLFNPITSIAGVKLFPGGPYPDAGLGDKQAQQAQAYMAQLAPVIAQIAQMAGVANPLNPQASAQATNPAAFGPTGPNPYALSPLQQSALNQQLSTDTTVYDKIMGQVKADLAARGMSDSSTMTAAQAYLKTQLANQQGQESVQAGQNAYQNKQGALQQIAGLLGQGYGAQAAATASQKASAEQATANAQGQIGSLLGLGLWAGGVLPGAGGKQAQTPVGTPPFSGYLGGGAFPGIDLSSITQMPGVGVGPNTTPQGTAIVDPRLFNPY